MLSLGCISQNIESQFSFAGWRLLKKNLSFVFGKKAK